MVSQRAIRFYLESRATVASLICVMPFVGISGLIYAYTNMLAWKILFAAIFVCLAPIAVFFIMTLLFVRIFPWPTIEMDGVGIIYRAPYAPWRKIVVPWADVTHMGFYRWGGGTGVYGRPVSAQTVFLIHTRRPDRYGSRLKRRVSAWLSPGFGDATIAVSLDRLNLNALESDKAFLDTIKTAFAPEIAEYRIAVTLHN